MANTFVRGAAAIVAIGLTCAVPGRALVAQPADVALLEGDNVVERRLDPRAEHRYTIALAPAEHARVIVEQRGIDVVVEIRNADDAVIARFEDDIRSAGEEQVDVIGDATRVETIVVRAAPGVAVAGAYAIRVADRLAATDGDRALRDARALRTTAAQLEADGRFEAARLQLDRALTLTEGVRGADDVQTAAVAAQLAGVCRRLPDNPRSEALFERALSIMDASLGPDHPTTAVTRSRFAQLYQNMGQRAKSEALLTQALDAIDKAIGRDNRWYVGALVTMATLRREGGEFKEDEAILRRALATLERTDDAESGLYAGVLNNLGENYRMRGDGARAEEFYQQSLAIEVRVLGEDAYGLGPTLQNLGVLARERKDYATAEAYYTRVLSIRERAAGPNHPDVAQILNNMAIIHRARGDTAKSLETLMRALSIWEHASGPYQEATLIATGNIARTYAAFDDVAHAVEYQQRADAILEKQLALNLAIGSERQKLLFATNAASRTDRTLSLALLDARGRPDADALAATVLLQRKGRVQDAMADTFAAARLHTADARDRYLLARLEATTAQLARLALSAQDPARADTRQADLQRMEAEKERLEAELSARRADLRAGLHAVTLDAVQAAIPLDAALVEFALFRPFDPRAERNAEAYGAPRYAAYALRTQVAPRGVDLGPAAPIDAAVAALRSALRDPQRADVKARARALDELIMRPLRGSFGDATRLLLSPDGELSLVPFEALVDEQGRYLIERYATSYVTSGRDLLRMQVPRASRSHAVVFADPLFGEPGPAHAESAARKQIATNLQRRSVTTGTDLSSVYFAPLAATGDEARAIKRLFPEASLFMGGRATKAALQRLQAPRMLHIASHGFFLQDAGGDPKNPLVRSGLALAGANLRSSAADRGILTALEASELDLWGTKLVTLSACDTGVGEIRSGEGVYGLRRAFVLAGTETLVMSLWPVSDAFSRDMMVSYYAGLRAGLGRGDALRESKLAMMKRDGRRHPFYWASFIQSGDWTPLDDKQ